MRRNHVIPAVLVAFVGSLFVSASPARAGSAIDVNGGNRIGAPASLSGGMPDRAPPVPAGDGQQDQQSLSDDAPDDDAPDDDAPDDDAPDDDAPDAATPDDDAPDDDAPDDDAPDDPPLEPSDGPPDGAGRTDDIGTPDDPRSSRGDGTATAASAAATPGPASADAVGGELRPYGSFLLGPSLLRASTTVRALQMLRGDVGSRFAPSPGRGFLAGTGTQQRLFSGRAALASGFLGHGGSLFGGGDRRSVGGSGFLGGASLSRFRMR